MRSRRRQAPAAPVQVQAPAPHPSGARPPQLPPELVPRHVAVVMDGNGRWANSRGLPRTAGHEAGKLHADLSRSQDAPRFTEWFAVEGGTVTITAATAERIDGRLTLTFRDGPHTATAEGTFTAVPGR